MTILIDAVDAVNTDHAEKIFAGLALSSAIVAAIAHACTVDDECDEKFFADVKTERWGKEKVNDWLTDMGITGGMKTIARNRMLSWVGGGGSSSSSAAKSSDVKIEPEVAAEKARAAARDTGDSEEQTATAGKIAFDKQMSMNEKTECTSVYARALRSEGGEGVKIDRALMGEDTENELVEEDDGSLVIKRPTAASVADKWKSLEDAQEGISEMQQRAQEDGKIHIVSRLRGISDY